jgi:Helicase HerA, central domain
LEGTATSQTGSAKGPDEGHEFDVGRDSRGKEFDLDPSVLTRHAIVLGATGSGKTVFCKAIIEEAALRGIPVLAIDPKGDISCLAVSSKDFMFRPYSDVEADSMKKPREEYAQELQALYSEKTKESGVTPERVAKFVDAVEVKIFTPKSSSGIPVSISPKLDAPPQFKEWVDEQPGTVADLLDLSVNSLLNIVRPERSSGEDQQAVSFLSSILEDQWKKGEEVDLKSLIDLVLHPPFERVGDLPLDQIFPRKERQKLAADLNLFNSHPRLRAWTQGEPLDFDRLFHSGPKTPVNVVDLRGIQSQEERFFFVEMLLQQLYGWIMKQQGVQNLRFLLYFDEVAGYCPPVREPPSKKSLLLLIKQARAFGLGIILATQNPIDIDYKVISNANVRLIGRLATERDVERVKAGLELPDDSALTIQTLEKGQFLCQIFDPRVSGIVSPRWLMTYHRGPLRDEEINSLMAGLKEGPHVEAEPSTPALPRDQTASSRGAEAGTVAVPEGEQPSAVSMAEGPSQPTAPQEPLQQLPLLGMTFAIKPEEVSDHVRKQRKIFGQPEVIVDVRQVYRPLMELGVGLKTGVLTRKYQTKYVFLDAATGRDVGIGSRLVFQPGLEKLLGLDSRDVEVLRALSDDKYSSAIDVATKMKISADLTRYSLQELERRRLVKSAPMGRGKAYQRISVVPGLELKEAPLNLTAVEPVEGIQPPKGPTESELREVVRGLRQDYDLVSCRPFYYPLYSVSLALGSRSRTVWIDGVTGEETQV